MDSSCFKNDLLVNRKSIPSFMFTSLCYRVTVAAILQCSPIKIGRSVITRYRTAKTIRFSVNIKKRVGCLLYNYQHVQCAMFVCVSACASLRPRACSSLCPSTWHCVVIILVGARCDVGITRSRIITSSICAPAAAAVDSGALWKV